MKTETVKKRDFSRIVSFWLLPVVVLALVIYGLSNYNALLDSDSYAYLSYALTLSRGGFFGEYRLYDVFKPYWPSSGRLNLHYGLRHMINGKIYYGIEPGYPLLLVGAIKLFGFNAVYFVNPFLLLVLVIFYFLVVRRLFISSSNREAVAFLSVFLLLFLPPHRILLSSMKIMRDTPPLTFLIISLYFLLLFCQQKRKTPLYLFISAFFLGLAVTIRLTYLLNTIPFCLYLIASLWEKRLRLGKMLLSFFVALLGLSVFVIPIFIVDIKVNKDILFTVRIIKNYLLVVSVPSKLFSTVYLKESGVWYLDYLLRVYSPFFLLLALVGLIAARRVKPVLLFLCPLLVLHFTVFAVFKYKHARYLLPLYPILNCMIGFGIVRLLEAGDALKGRLIRDGSHFSPSALGLFLAGAALFCYEIVFRLIRARSGPGVQDLFLFTIALGLLGFCGYFRGFLNSRVLIPVLLVGTLVLFCSQIAPSISSSPSFKLSDVNRLRREFEKYTPSGSLIFSARDLKQNLDIYTDCFSMSLRQLGGPWGLPPDRAIRTVMDAGIEVFVVDNKGKRKAYKFLPVLKKYFEIIPVTSWKSRELKLRRKYYSERPELRLYRVLPWREKEVSLSLNPAPGRDHLLIVDAREIWSDPARKELKLSINDRPLSGTVRDNLNYIYLSGGALQSTPSTFRMVSDRGLPPELPVRLFEEIDRDLRIEMGEASGSSDWGFLGESCYQVFSSPSHRTLAEKGEMKIPTFSVPGRRAHLKLKVKNHLGELSPLRLNLEIGGDSIAVLTLPAGDQWTVLEAELPSTPGEIGTAWLDLNVSVIDPPSGSAPAEKGLLDIDWMAVEWRPPAADQLLPNLESEKAFSDLAAGIYGMTE